jgi:hypothetical protein
MYTYTVHCTVQIYELESVLQGPGKFLWLIFLGLSNKVYHLNVYTKQNLHLTKLYLTKFIHNKVYK